MVLADLGSKITSALQDMVNSTVIDDTVIKKLLNDISRALLQADVSLKIIQSLVGNIKGKINLEDMPSGVNKRRVVQKIVFEELVKMVDPGIDPFKPKKGRSNVFMFVGLQGSGKTTTCSKLAAYYQRQGWKTGLVCADTFRAGAFDQLKQNATKARVPYYGSYTETDPVRVAYDGVKLFKDEKFDVIIVDTSGRHKQAEELFKEMVQVSTAVSPDEVIFVMDASIGQAAYDQAKGFSTTVDIGSVIITKMDGHAKGGGALSAVAATHSPVSFVGTGEHLDDLDVFQPQTFIQQLLGMGDIPGLLKKFEKLGEDIDEEELLRKLRKGEFNLRDLYQQFEMLMKMGPLDKVMQMIPHMSKMIPKGSEKEGTNKLKRFTFIMDSMTDEELDNPKVLFSNHSRLVRIARGSGSSVDEVKELINNFKKSKKLFSGMNLSPAAMEQMQRNPQAAMQQMQRRADPRMMQQLSGMMSGLGSGNMFK